MALRQPRLNDLGIEAVPWSTLRPHFMAQWEQGAHSALIGPSGSGKTTLAFDILEGRIRSDRNAHVIAFFNKRRDPLFTKLERSGWPRIQRWPPHYEHRVSRRVMLWPHYGKASTTGRRNRPIFVEALDEIIEEGSWFCFLDDAVYYVETLKLRLSLDEYWNAARSSRVTVIGAAQAASWIPKSMTTNQSWLFAFKSRDQDVRKRVAEVAGDRRFYSEVMDRLGPHEFVIIQTTTGEAYVSDVRS